MGLFNFFKKKSASQNDGNDTSKAANDVPLVKHEEKPVNVQAEENPTHLARKLAHTVNLSMDQSEEKALETKLLAGGKTSQIAIGNYLCACGDGSEPSGWWNNASRLVRMIPKFGTGMDAEAKHLLQSLLERQSNLWEYETQIRNVAKELLEAYEKKNEQKKEPEPIPATQKVNRKMTNEQEEQFKKQEPLKFYKCKFFGNRIYAMQDGVVLNGWWFIPYKEIKEVVMFPVLEKGPALGGCLKFVTADNPALPIRDGHSFHMPGQKDGMGGYITDENCFWFNCGADYLCKGVNEAVEEIKEFIESKLLLC